MIRCDGEAVDLQVDRTESLAAHYTLSPYVVAAKVGFVVLLRLVNRSDDPDEKVSRIHAGTSQDGQTFIIGERPVIEPDGTLTEDSGGCEDPTVVTTAGQYVVFYSGYSSQTRASYMLSATGPSSEQLRKSGVAFSSTEHKNPKEAAIIAVGGGYRMFFEYAADERSKIGVADAPSLAGPWTFAQSPIQTRPAHFDAYHLSPVSAVHLSDGRLVLFYNGSTKTLAWRIGWAILDASAEHVLERCDEPLVSEEKPEEIEDGDTDIAFGASTVVVKPDYVWLYYSISDRILRRRSIYVPGARSDAALSRQEETPD